MRTLLGLTIAYVAAGKLGLSMAFVNESASAVWPPTGIALAACLLLGRRAWPAIALGAFLVNFTTSGAIGAALAIAAGNTLEGIVGAALVTRFARGRAAFETAADVFRFAVIAVVATSLAATIGVGALLAAGLTTPAQALTVFVTWWVGDMVGAMLVAPPIVLWATPPRVPVGPRSGDLALVTLTLASVSYLVFGNSPVGARGYPLQFLVIPLLLWSAFRLGAREAATAAAAVSAVAIAGTLNGLGPFARGSPNESLVLLQAFMGVASIVTVAVSAEVTARRAASAALRALNDSLETRVAARTEELQKLHDRLQEAQETAHVGSWEWDVDANSLWWSDEMHRIYGLAPEAAATYEDFLSRVHPDDRDAIRTSVQQALDHGQPFALEHRIIRPDGSIRVLQARGRAIRDAAGRTIRLSGVGHDITEIKQAEEERAQLFREQAARREAEEASRGKDEFLATLSHELRTPMNAVLGWARTLVEMPLDDRRRNRALEAIFRNVQIQAQIVSDIVDVSRITRGALRLELRRTDVVAVVESAIEIVRTLAQERRVAIEADLPALPVELDADDRRLQQVVWNLLANAVKFAGDGGRVVVAVRASEDAAEIIVEDNGPGIDPAFLPHVFDPFRQADGSLTRAHGGLGLGLAIVRHIVELHGGTVTAANGRDGGATFRVHLPRVERRAGETVLAG